MPKITERGASYAGRVDVSPADAATPDWAEQPAAEPEPAPPARPRARRRTRGGTTTVAAGHAAGSGEATS